jgi:hypothetical protein
MDDEDGFGDRGSRGERRAQLAGALLLVGSVSILAGCTGDDDRSSPRPVPPGSQHTLTPSPEPNIPTPTGPGTAAPLPIWPSETGSLVTSPPDAPNAPRPTPTLRISPAFRGTEG